MTAGPRTARPGFSLVELLVAVTVIAILAALTLAAFTPMRSIAQEAYCANSLRQLGMATGMYLGDHQNKFFAYEKAVPGGVLWYFGFETSTSLSQPEGARTVDETQSPLYPYINQVGGVEVCPSFPYGSPLWERKYKGASWGYGLNTYLSNENILTLRPSLVMLFGDCAQVDTFQAPASPGNPMIEEFYMIQNTYLTVHFRHGNHANILFLDGHVESMSMYPGTLDTRLPQENIGRITPVGSMQYLQ